MDRFTKEEYSKSTAQDSSMQGLAILVSLVIILIGATITKYSGQKSENILGETNPTEKLTPPSTPTPSLSPTPTPTIRPTNKPTPTPKIVDNQGLSIEAFRYPSASVKTASSHSLILESTDNADAITNWYKEKITSAGMNAKSFVSTKTNGNVKNVLVASNGKTEVRVVIEKSASEKETRIVVTIQTS